MQQLTQDRHDLLLLIGKSQDKTLGKMYLHSKKNSAFTYPKNGRIDISKFFSGCDANTELV